MSSQEGESDTEAPSDCGPNSTSGPGEFGLISHCTEELNENNEDITCKCVSYKSSDINSKNNPYCERPTAMLQSYQNKIEGSAVAEPCNESQFKERDDVSNISEDFGSSKLHSIHSETNHNAEVESSYPFSNSKNPGENINGPADENALILPYRDDSSYLQSITKISPKFTLNVESNIGDLTALHNVVQAVTSSSQTLWLPTILTADPSTSVQNDLFNTDNVTQSGVSQIILTNTGENYVSPHNENSPLINAGKFKHSHTSAEIISNPQISPSKVQILSNIALSKHTSLSVYHTQQGLISPCNKEPGGGHNVYAPQATLYKSTSVNSKPHVNSSVLNMNNKVPKSQMMHNSYTSGGHFTNPMLKGNISSSVDVVALSVKSSDNHLNKSYSKINTGSPSVAPLTTVNSHVLSRMVPGPKLSGSQSNKYKNVSTFGANQKQSKVSAAYAHSNKMQNSMPIKIIQQPTAHKQTLKNWQPSRATLHATKNSSYSSASVKNVSMLPSQTTQSISQKMNTQVNVIKELSSNVDQKVVMANSSENLLLVQQPKLPSHHGSAVQHSGVGIRFTHSFIGSENPVSTSTGHNNPHVSANQHLTAQILQSLSQAKAPPVPSAQQLPNTHPIKQIMNNPYMVKRSTRKRYVYGDPTTIITADDIIGTEERPNISQEIFPFHYLYNLQLVMLDHTYSKEAITTLTVNNTTAGTPTAAPLITSIPANSSLSPTKVNILQSPPLIAVPSQSNIDNQTHSSPPSVPLQTTLTASQNVMMYKPACSVPKEDDDAGSVISSTDGEQRPRADSDTETAPEGEEEGKTRCVCDFTHDDGYMICCDRCCEWQHVDCMGIDRQNIPDDYMCERCQPRSIDRRLAKAIQLRKQEELKALTAPSDSDSPSGASHTVGNRRRRLLTVTTYSNTSSANRHIPYRPPATVPQLPQPPKRGPKRPRRNEMIRKGIKRKLSDKRPKKKREMINHRNKFNSMIGTTSEHNQWSDIYEQAMTNHYSPELRAKLNRYGGKLTSANQINSAITAHHCTTVPHAGGKILIATKDLKESTPIIELRGKYMLSAQQRVQPLPSGRAGSQRPGPFLFFYRLPRDNTQVCIDTRTYGNEARFVRRSCKPNAELQHCIVKGTLHVYLITISAIQSNTEITILHDSSNGKQACACGNPKYCRVNGLNTLLSYKTMQQGEQTLREKRHSRRTSAASPASPPLNSFSKEAPLITPDLKTDKKRLGKIENEQENILKEQEVLKNLFPDTTSHELEPLSSKILDLPVILDDSSIKLEKSLSDNVTNEIEEKHNVIKIEPAVDKSRENTPELEQVESKLSTILEVELIKEDEKVEKPKEEKLLSAGMTRRSSSHATRSNRISITTSQESADEKSDESFETKQSKPNHFAKDKKKLTREERKLEAIMKAIERMEKEEQRKQEVKDRQSKRRESDTQNPTTSTIGDLKDGYDQDDDINQQTILKRRRKLKGRARTASLSQSNISRNRLNSADSDFVTSGDEGLAQVSPLFPQPQSSNISQPNYKLPPQEEDSLFSSSLYASNIRDGDVGLSSACLLVEAAVGPLESAFKLPKTKKSLVNEWLGKSPERSSYVDMGNSPTYMSSNDNNNDSPLLPIDKRPLSLESLVHVAATMIGNLSGGTICADSSPEKSCSNDSSKLELLPKTPIKLSPGSSPVKWMPCMQTDLTNSMDSITNSPQRVVPKRSPRNILRDIPQISPPPDKGKLPKKYRKNIKSILEERPLSGANKRVLRSGLITVSPTPDNGETAQPNFEEENSEQIVFVEPSSNLHIASSTLTGLQPPQHSAKKRWLRQAISEESDSPTAESPPNEMITPLKKRRLARESLSSDLSTLNAVDENNASLFLSPLKEIISERNNQAVNLSTYSSIKNNHNISSNKELIFKKEDDDDSSHIDSGNLYNCTDDLLNIDLKSASKDSKRKLNLDIERIIGVPPKLEESFVDSKDDLKQEIKTESDLKHELNNSLLSPVKIKNNFKKEYEKSPNKCESDIPSIETFPETPSKAQFETGLSEKGESVSNINSTETSGNSSPLLDEMDDIQKKIHSFHTENIQILKIRNKKQPKEKRKKVNLNFDLCVLADQTVSVKLRSETENVSDNKINTETENVSDSKIGVETEDVCDSKTRIETKNTSDKICTESENVLENTMRIDTENVCDKNTYQINGEMECDVFESMGKIEQNALLESSTVSEEQPETILEDKTPISEIPETIDLNTDECQKPLKEINNEGIQETKATDISNNDKAINKVKSLNLFSAIFDKEKISSTDADIIPNMHILKNAIDMTANMESSIFEKSSTSPLNEYKNAQEIITRVNKIDPNNSLLLSGVLRETITTPTLSQQKSPTPTKVFNIRSNDPRLNPPPANKPKPVRRKLSISEYRKRHNMCTTSDGARSGSDSNGSTSSTGNGGVTGVIASSTGNAPSPLRLDEDDIDTRLEKQLEDSITEQSLGGIEISSDQKGVFNAQPTQLEKQRENLSERLRREFGLSLPEDEEARPATSLQGSWSSSDGINLSTAIQMHIPTIAAGNLPDSSGILQRGGTGDSESPGIINLPKFPRLDR